MATRRATIPKEAPKQAKIILGIDPGTNLTGYALLEVTGNKRKLLTLGVIRTGVLKDADHADKLGMILLKMTEIIKMWKPQEAAVEAPFYGKNPQSMLKLGRVQGVVMAAAIANGVPITEYSPRLVKKAVTGGGAASKAQVAALLSRQLPELPSFTDSVVADATDALAVAICHANRMDSPLAAIKGYSGWDAFLKDNPERLIKR
jgi:crossover junction endodeoxyribonuclease RuvC